MTLLPITFSTNLKDCPAKCLHSFVRTNSCGIRNKSEVAPCAQYYKKSIISVTLLVLKFEQY